MATKRQKKSEPIHIRNVLGSVLDSCRSEGDMDLTAIWSLWDQVVGETIAENARPTAFKGKMLLVSASSSVWIHQLRFLKAEIIDNVNRALGKKLVEDIKFKVGNV